MPEGDTIHNHALALRPLLVGAIVQRAESRGAGALRRLVGLRVDAVIAQGKTLWIHFEKGPSLRIHLKMNGYWRALGQAEPSSNTADSATRSLAKHAGAALYLGTDRSQVACYRTREVAWVRVRRGGEGEPAYTVPSTQGPDAMDPSTTAELAAARARSLVRSDAPVAQALLDQRVVAGLGNVFKCEALHRCGLHPATPLVRLPQAELEGLFRVALKQLRRNFGVWPRRTVGKPGRAGPKLSIYGRRDGCGQCGTLPHQSWLGEPPRVTWWCPRCQPPRDSEVVPAEITPPPSLDRDNCAIEP